ncbi:MAG: Gfo/Idh/MocA family oxidoreductase [Planctomycetes bacterium]|jgi:predicted dehydrogenase|nr:Gfo/Idh/MocA family oxidoreductase [Planctomycetota bacterium]
MSFRVAVIGAGRMGKLHARIISEMSGAELVCVVDTNEAAAKAVARQRNCQAFASTADVLDLVDAAVIAVPTLRHIEAARPFVAAGKAVLIEKPICNDPAGARELIELARKTGAVLQVGHTERFNPVVLAMQKFDIRPKFIEAHRISPFTFRSADVGVVLDMMIHDLDLVLKLAGGNVENIHAVGINVIGAHEDICSARLMFDNGCVANVTASRLAIKTERKMRLFSEEAYISVDYAKKVGIAVRKAANMDLIQMAREMDVEDLAELAETVDYTKLLHFEELKVDETTEPLRQQAEAFQRSVVEGAPPTVPASEGLAALELARDIVEAVKSYHWDGASSPRSGLDILKKAQP